MATTVTLELTDEMLQRYQQGAAAARKRLETFMVERLDEAVPPIENVASMDADTELAAIEEMNDSDLWQIARSKLPADQQERYDELLDKNSTGAVTPAESQELHQLGDQARRVTLRKAHAFMLLKWRGYAIPTRAELRQSL